MIDYLEKNQEEDATTKRKGSSNGLSHYKRNMTWLMMIYAESLVATQTVPDETDVITDARSVVVGSGNKIVHRGRVVVRVGECMTLFSKNEYTQDTIDLCFAFCERSFHNCVAKFLRT